MYAVSPDESLATRSCASFWRVRRFRVHSERYEFLGTGDCRSCFSSMLCVRKVNLADFFIFVCKVSTRQKLSTCNVLRLLLVSAFISLLSHLLDVNKHVDNLLTGDDFTGRHMCLSLHGRGYTKPFFTISQTRNFNN